MSATSTQLIRSIAACTLLLGLAACNESDSNNKQNSSSEDDIAVSCIADSPLYRYSDGLHAPAANPLPQAASRNGGAPAQQCS
ncbi:MAG: hypothetical protein ACSHWQ_02820, partial [Spongiibacteraceae bacterium]